ncbi:MAG: cyclic nucleotide-binding domain-containing protein [Methylacidiphilales bacterium]|nr:cyclic nucleotide-binding domain-containing protein [Candidatus Methylacidiphilales bacterium]
MDDDAREKFATYGAVVSTTPGQVILQEGDANLNLYVVLQGAFGIVTKATGRAVPLDTVGPGDCLGEVAVFQPGVASATVTSQDNGQLWAIDVDHLQQFLLDWPHYGCAAVLGINTILSRRLKRANAVIRSNEIIPDFLSVRSRKRAESVK